MVGLATTMPSKPESRSRLKVSASASGTDAALPASGSMMATEAPQAARLTAWRAPMEPAPTTSTRTWGGAFDETSDEGKKGHRHTVRATAVDDPSGPTRKQPPPPRISNQ